MLRAGRAAVMPRDPRPTVAQRRKSAPHGPIIGAFRESVGFTRAYGAALVVIMYVIGGTTHELVSVRYIRTPRRRGARGRGYGDSPPPIVSPQNPPPRAPAGQRAFQWASIGPALKPLSCSRAVIGPLGLFAGRSPGPAQLLPLRGRELADVACRCGGTHRRGNSWALGERLLAVREEGFCLYD